MKTHHTWKFFRAGDFDQVRLDDGADLLALDQLDQKLWVALACPTTGLEFDRRTLALVDTDGDGRIRAPEIIAAVKWAAGCLKNPDDLTKPSAALPLAAINDASAEGKQLVASAQRILSNLGKQNPSSITVEDTLDTAKIFGQTNFNGDGIIPVEAADDEATRGAITEIINCLGPETDRSGKPGVNQAKVEQFFTEAQSYSEWWRKAEADPAILPWRDGTESAAATFHAVRPKVEDYFTRCRLAAYDVRAVGALNREEKDYLALASKDLSPNSVEIAALPLAQVAPNRPLPLDGELNPAWTEPMAAFRAQVVQPLLDRRDSLSGVDWTLINTKFAAYQAWLAAKPGVAVEKVGLNRLRELLSGPGKERILELIAKDKALEPEATAIGQVERLVRYHRDLYTLLNNFVSFRDFYRHKARAIFQAGTLYLDQRSCDLCIGVQDPAKHAIMASLAGTYLAYCDCFRKSTGQTRQIVAAFTNGDSDNLMVGRNGIFYDRAGCDWDATITKIVDNPISIRQAFWSPYKKVARMIQEQITKRAAAADEAATARLAQAAAKVDQAATQPPAPRPTLAPAPEAAKKVDPGLIAALSIGAAGLGATLGAILTGFLNLRWLMPMGVLAVILIISGPAMLLAWLKLRRRNLGPILDANGWAVNAKARINVPFGASLTRVASLPAGAQRDLADPFAEKKRPWALYLILIIILALGISWAMGAFDAFLPGGLTSSHVFPGKAPPETAPARKTPPEQPAK